MNKTFLGAFLASVFISFTACSEENLEQDTNPPTEQPGDSTDPDDSGEDQLPEYPTPDRSTVAAFPGAEGAGKLTTGGAGGTVYTVTSLKDDGSEGTLRWAIEKSGKRERCFLQPSPIAPIDLFYIYFFHLIDFLFCTKIQE